MVAARLKKSGRRSAPRSVGGDERPRLARDRALVPVVVATNQSGIGRGLFSEADYERVDARMKEMLAERAARIDATYFCPHAPEDGCRCRKPDTLMFEWASDDLRIDLSSALFIGDLMRDVGFKPQTSIEDGIRDFVAWYRGHYNV